MSALYRILALDPGDVWIGTALSDGLCLTCAPYTTIEAVDIFEFLTTFFLQAPDVAEVVVGCPTTVGRGADSLQTGKVRDFFNLLTHHFPDKKFVLWDERYSSSRASSLAVETRRRGGKPGSAAAKEEKRRSHSVAAAFILQSYLDYMRQQAALKEFDSE